MSRDRKSSRTSKVRTNQFNLSDAADYRHVSVSSVAAGFLHVCFPSVATGYLHVCLSLGLVCLTVSLEQVNASQVAHQTACGGVSVCVTHQRGRDKRWTSANVCMVFHTEYVGGALLSEYVMCYLTNVITFDVVD